MKVTLYRNYSDSDTLEKRITLMGETNGAPRGELSVINPILDIGETFGVGIGDCNYIFIHELNRYYHVKEKTIITANTWRFELGVDVLYTYKNQIRQLTAIIDRNAYKYNLLLADPLAVTQQNTQQVAKAFPRGFNSNGSYILTVAGG